MASFPFFLATNKSIFCIGPGRYNALTDAMSSIEVGPNLRNTCLIPSDSNWKTPTVSPLRKSSKVFSSSKGISSKRKSF